MAEPLNPEHRLRNLQRKLRDLVLGHRSSADPERTGVVDLSDFGKRCEAVAELARESTAALAALDTPEGRCTARVAEEVELACDTAGLLEALPPGRQRADDQASILEEAAAALQLALDAECLLEEAEVAVSLSALARREIETFAPFVEIGGTVHNVAAAPALRGKIRRNLRRALLESVGIRLAVDVSPDGVLTFGERRYESAAAAEDVTRSENEPDEVRKCLDMRENAGDPALRDFLLARAVLEALRALLTRRLRDPAVRERARRLPRRPGKRGAVRPEALTVPVEGWDLGEAGRAAQKLAAGRGGPEWTGLPKGVYPLRLFIEPDDALAADLLALAPALRGMERGEAVEGTEERSRRALGKLLGLLG